ncbi:unnamed protein product [Closterium sp. NIES-54]
MYAATDSAEGDCYLCVPPDQGIDAAALGASESAAPGTSESASPGAGESALSGTAPTEALHTFTLDSGASCSFFRDSTTLTPLNRPVAVSLADPSRGPVLAHSSTVLPCPAAPSGLLSGLHLPLFSTNLVSGADLQDAWVDKFTPGGQRVTHCTCSRTGRHLATFTRRPGSSLYTLNTASPPVTTCGQVAACGQVFFAASRSTLEFAPCSCRPLSHETLLWHHHLGHPSLPRLQGIASCTLVSGLPRSLPPLPPGPAPTCVPCVEGQQRAAPHSSELPPTEAPLHTLHMEVWGPAHVRGQGHEHYFLLVVDDYSRYTIVFPLHHKGEVTEVLIDWICGARRQLCESFGSDLPVLRLHSDKGVRCASDQPSASCLLAGDHTYSAVEKRRLAMRLCSVSGDLELLSVILPRTSCPPVPFPASSLAAPLTHLGGTSTTPLRVVFCPLRTSRLTSRYPTTVSFPTALPLSPPPPLFLAPGAPPVDPLPPLGPVPSGVSQVDPVEPVEVAVDSGTARGAEPAGAGPGGAEHGVAESEGAEPGGAEPERVEPGGAEPGGVESGGAESGGAYYSASCWRCFWAGDAGGADAAGAAGAAGPGGAGAGGAGAVGSPTGVGAAGGASGVGAAGGAAGARAARAGGAGAGGTGPVGGPAGVGAAGGAGAAGSGAVSTRGAAGAEGTGAVSAVSGGAARPRPYRTAPSAGSWSPAFYWSYSSLTESTACQSQSQLQPASPLPGSSPYSGPTRGLTKRRELESRPASPESRPESPVRTGRRVPRQHPPPVHGTHSMTLRPSTAPQHVPLPSPPASSLPALADPESDSLRTASPTVTRLLATVVIDPSFESTAASALVAELVAFAALCRLDYATSLVA